MYLQPFNTNTLYAYFLINYIYTNEDEVLKRNKVSVPTCVIATSNLAIIRPLSGQKKTVQRGILCPEQSTL